MADKIKMKELLNECFEVISPLLSQKPAIQFTNHADDSVPKKFNGDKMKVKQILVNLLSNAVKFTKEGSIHLKVSAVSLDDIKKSSNKPSMLQNWTDQTSTDYLRFSVKDTGIGVHENDLETIFSAFEQVRTTYIVRASIYIYTTRRRRTSNKERSLVAPDLA